MRGGAAWVGRSRWNPDPPGSAAGWATFLDSLRQRLTSDGNGAKQAVHGLGGVGKTQLTAPAGEMPSAAAIVMAPA